MAGIKAFQALMWSACGPHGEVVHVRLKDVESLPMAATAFFLALKIKTMSHLWRGPSSAFWRSSLSTGTARLYPPMTSWIYRHRPLFVPSICPHRSNLELDNHSLLSYKDHTCMRLYSQQLIMQNATMAQTLVSSRTALFRTRACVHWHKPNHHRTN